MENRDKDAKARSGAGPREQDLAVGRRGRRGRGGGRGRLRLSRGGGGARRESARDQGNRHVQTLNEPIPPYNSDPPTSGPHLPYIAPWGIHTEPLPRQLQVHNLEDGGVMVQYNCPEGCPDLVAKLKAIVSGYEHQVILAPYPGMKTRIALTAWTKLDAFDDFDEKRIRRFITAYRGIDHHPR